MDGHTDLQEEVIGQFKDRKQNELLRLIHKHNINENDPVWVVLDCALASFIAVEDMQKSVEEVSEHVGRFKKAVYDAATVSGGEVKDIILHTLTDASNDASDKITKSLTTGAVSFRTGVDALMNGSVKKIEEASNKAVADIKKSTTEMTKDTLDGFKLKLEKTIEETSSNMIQYQISKNIVSFSAVCVFFMIIGGIFAHFVL